MFRIAPSYANVPVLPSAIDPHAPDILFLQQYCSSDHWVGDLDSGLFKLGKLGALMHGIDSGDCGLLSLLRTYQPDDRVKILQIFEKASSQPSKFCFCTNAIRDGQTVQPVICLGESAGFSDQNSGSLTGIFLFPRFQMAMPD